MNKSKDEFFLFKLVNYFLLFVCVSIFFTLLYFSIPTISENGLSLFSFNWDPTHQHFGIFPFIVGTLLTTFLAFIFSLPLSISLSLILGEYFAKSKIAGIFQSLLEIISGIPSIIVGFWGAFFLSPIIISTINHLVTAFPFLKHIPLLGLSHPSSFSIFTASIILAFMIVPFSAFLGQEAVNNVSSELKETGYALGATTYEVITLIIFPSIKTALIAGFLLSIGRALGETMAVTLVIGNRNTVPESLFSPGQTIASLIANEFSESTDQLHTSSIVFTAFILFTITLVINVIGRTIIKKLSHHD